MQARHLWSFSTLLMAQPQQWGFQAALVRHAADSVYAFMRENMLKDVKKGELWAWDGLPDTAKCPASTL